MSTPCIATVISQLLRKKNTSPPPPVRPARSPLATWDGDDANVASTWKDWQSTELSCGRQLVPRHRSREGSKRSIVMGRGHTGTASPQAQDIVLLCRLSRCRCFRVWLVSCVLPMFPMKGREYHNALIMVCAAGCFATYPCSMDG